jgi:threonine synthase
MMTDEASGGGSRRRAASMWDWAEWLALPAGLEPVTLGEGMTPLLPSRLFADAAVRWKCESHNPTGSQKDRAMSLAISHARLVGARAVVAASTGSVGLACAAYAARGGLPCIVLVPRGTARQRLVPIAFHGAAVLTVDGSFEEIETILAGLDPGRWYQASTVTRINRIQAEAPMTIAFEIVDQAGGVPDWMVVPVGGGATIAGIWRGFQALQAVGRIDRLPRLAAIQPVAFDAIARAFRGNRQHIGELADAELPGDGETVLSNLKHRVPPDGDLALAAVRQSGGTVVTVSDAAALAGQARLAAVDGLLCEPSAAVVVDAVERLVADRVIAPGALVVGLLTGSGLRELGSLPAPPLPLLAPDQVPAAMEQLLTP